MFHSILGMELHRGAGVGIGEYGEHAFSRRSRYGVPKPKHHRLMSMFRESITSSCARIHHPLLVEERGNFLPTWRCLLLVVVLYDSVIIPWRVTFGHVAFGWMFWFEMFLDLLFIIDVILNFLTAYRNEEGRLVTDYRSIARRYLRSWFLPDIISALPLELLVVAFGSFTITSSGILAARSLKLFRLFRLLSLFRLSRISRTLESRFAISSPIYRIARFVCFVIISTHWSACMRSSRPYVTISIFP